MKKLIPKPNSSFTIVYQPPLWVIKCYSIDHDMISSDLNYATHLAKKQTCYFFFTLGLDLYWYDPHAHLLIKWLISNPCNRRFKWLRNSLTVHTHFCEFHQPKLSQIQTITTASQRAAKLHVLAAPFFDAANNKSSHDLLRARWSNRQELSGLRICLPPRCELYI